ncbi:MAG: SufE family protein [Ectothiorhodospiraceae bacterium]|nr:SufE family protein [Ectothiorhodospiraceae bacterium]
MRATPPAPIHLARERLVAEFLDIPDWVDRYHFIIEHGSRLQPPRPGDHPQRIGACASLVLVCSGGSAHRLEFRGCAECPIDAGLVAMVFRIYAGQPAEDALVEDVDLVRVLQLPGRLTCQRLLGLTALVAHVRRHALRCLVESRCRPERHSA